MTSSGGELPARVAAEIRALRKGGGLYAADLDARLGPLMRELAGPGDTADRRRTLVAELGRCAARLHGDHGTAIEASLALSAETARRPTFQDRVEWLADHLGRTYRTALRRVDEAELLLAEEVSTALRGRLEPAVTAPDGWYVDELRTLLRLDTERMESHEIRRVVSVREDLTEVMAWLDLPSEAGQPGQPGQAGETGLLSAEMLYGGRLLRREQPSGSRYNLVVQLPKPLQPRQQHEYGLILRMPKHLLRRPYYLVTPECQCNKFDLRIRFDPDRPPAWVRRVDGETVRTFENGQPTGDLLVPDAAGEVHQEFTDMKMYLGYGIQWQPAGGPSR